MRENPHVAVDEESTQALNQRLTKHLLAVNTTQGGMQTYHQIAARGLYKVLRARFYAGDGEALPIGAAPHWLIYSDEQARRA